ncbi:hypothetical protein [Aquabacter spiritensis]|nr:hypothetical protein [Aquabacter spiritensis]
MMTLKDGHFVGDLSGTTLAYCYLQAGARQAGDKPAVVIDQRWDWAMDDALIGGVGPVSAFGASPETDIRARRLSNLIPAHKGLIAGLEGHLSVQTEQGRRLLVQLDRLTTQP